MEDSDFPLSPLSLASILQCLPVVTVRLPPAEVRGSPQLKRERPSYRLELAVEQASLRFTRLP